MRAFPCLLIASLFGTHAIAQDEASWPRPLVALLAVSAQESVEEAVLARTRLELEDLLRRSDSFSVLGKSPAVGTEADLVAFCGDRIACWRDVMERTGADLVVLGRINRLEDRSLEGRVWLIDRENVQTPPALPLPTDGGAPPDALSQILHSPGTLTVTLPATGHRVLLDPDTSPSGEGALQQFNDLPPGKHRARILFEEDLAFVRVVTIQPGGTPAFTWEPPVGDVLPPQRRARWGWYVAGALVAGTAAAIVVGTLRPGEGWRGGVGNERADPWQAEPTEDHPVPW
jgi:nucleotide-binding universal stress UspA family protein